MEQGRDFINADGGLAFGNTGFVVSVGHRRHAENHFQIILHGFRHPAYSLAAIPIQGPEFLFLEVRTVRCFAVHPALPLSFLFCSLS